MKPTTVLILGAAGRDFHNFLVHYKKNPQYKVVGFTATQIPGIDNKTFPAKLAGKRYPHGIPVFSQNQLTQLIPKLHVHECAFSYSDVSNEFVMHLAATCQAAGASFVLLGPEQTQLQSQKPVISVCAVRTGSGKSQTSRKIVEYFLKRGLRVVAVRHPMPYGDLFREAVQRFAAYPDFERHHCTIEEREEYERYIEKGMVVYAGVDYEKILRKAEREADVILWDGGNNDFSFFKPDLQIVVADPHRAGHEISYYPGETNFKSAGVLLINKIDSASKRQIQIVEQHARQFNPRAHIIKAKSVVRVRNPELLKNKRVLVLEDGPTTTHGGMPFGAGTILAQKLRCKIIDPRPYAVGSLKNTFQKFPHLHKILPAMGYSPTQIRELQQTIHRTPCDAVIAGTPIALEKLLKIQKPIFDVYYDLDDFSTKQLHGILNQFRKKNRI